jgi:hypothetical protein
MLKLPRSSRIPAAALSAAMLVTGMTATATASTRPSTIAYQCGSSICTIDPSAGAKHTIVARHAQLAGLTANGTTLAWLTANGALVTRPLAGTKLTTRYKGGQSISQPIMSPDGRRLIWLDSQVTGGAFPGQTVDTVWELSGRRAPKVLMGTSNAVPTLGWLRSTPIAAIQTDPSENTPSLVCRIDRVPPGGYCGTTLASDTRGDLTWPAASPNGKQIVASLDTGGAARGRPSFSQGRLVLYAAATHRPIRFLTAGPRDTSARFSPNGKQIVFSRGDKIAILTLSSGTVHTLAKGSYPFWSK